MSLVEESILVAVPVREAYDQWTQFEEFPRFMRHVERIEQLDDTHLHWTVNVAGHREEFDAEITEQIPDARIAWRSTSGPSHAGASMKRRSPSKIALCRDASSSRAVVDTPFPPR